jgi:hypothetical protein
MLAAKTGPQVIICSNLLCSFKLVLVVQTAEYRTPPHNTTRRNLNVSGYGSDCLRMWQSPTFAAMALPGENNLTVSTAIADEGIDVLASKVRCDEQKRSPKPEKIMAAALCVRRPGGTGRYKRTSA